MSETGEHGSEPSTSAGPWRPGTDWFVEDNPVESFGSTVERALRQLSIELAGIRAERDGLRLELEGLRAQYELVRQQLAERDRFSAAVSELTDIVRNLTLPPGWVHESATPVQHLQPAPPPAPVIEPTVAPTVPAPEPPAAPAPPTPSPVVLPSEPQVAPTFAAVPAPAAAPEPSVRPDGPDVVLAFAAVPVASDTSAFAPPDVTDHPAPSPTPPSTEAEAATVDGADQRHLESSDAERPPRAAQVDRFFEGPGIWLDEPGDHERRASWVSTWGSRIGIVVLGLFVATVLLVSVGPRFLPYQTYFVRSGSMEPTIETGAMILLTKVDAEDLEVGDIISFKRPDKPDTIVTHRIHAIEANESGRSFVTKGDANGTPDVWRVPATGTGWRYAAGVPKVGFVVGYLGTPIARLALLAIPAAILGILSLLDIWKPAKSTRARRGR